MSTKLNPFAGHSGLVEIFDPSGLPLLMLPEQEALQQCLPFRQVSILFHDQQGRYLLARSPAAPNAPSLWDLPTRGPVYAGEAREDAARRLLLEHLHISRPQLRPCPPSDTSFPALETCYVAHAAHEPPRIGPDIETLLVDEDELLALCREFTSLLSQPLQRAAARCLAAGAFS